MLLPKKWQLVIKICAPTNKRCEASYYCGNFSLLLTPLASSLKLWELLESRCDLIDRERTLLMLLTKALGASRALQAFAMMRKTHEYHKEMDIYERSTTIFRFKRQLDAACLE
jgi:hypothetical protein